MNEVQISVDGLEELSKDLEKLVSKYPDRAGDLLRKSAREFRKKYVQNVRSNVKHTSGRGKSLTKLATTKVYPIQGLGKKQYVDIGSTAPHFHLYERGHHSLIPRPVGRPTKDGKRKYRMVENGRVEGRKMMERTVDEYNEKLPEIAQGMIDELLKEGGFL